MKLPSVCGVNAPDTLWSSVQQRTNNPPEKTSSITQLLESHYTTGNTKCTWMILA